MAETQATFRDFGILPDDVAPPEKVVRASFSAGRVIGQYIATGIVAALGLGCIVLFLCTMTEPLGAMAAGAAAAGCGSLIYLATHNDYRWVELDGTTLRAGHLYTGRIIQRSLDEVDSLGTMVYAVRRTATVIVQHLLGRVRGIEIRFRDGRTPLRVMRADPAMTNAGALIEAVVYQLKQMGELETEVVQYAGKPLLRRIGFKGRPPLPPAKPRLAALLACLMLLAFLFGGILGYLGLQQQSQYQILSVAPQTMALQDLIEKGPGSNRHVMLTDFRPGGYTAETSNDRLTRVWLALFPAAPSFSATHQIQAILTSNAVRDEADVKALVQSGHIEAICSASPQKSWGAALGPELLKSNPGSQLTSAWSIEAVTEMPTATQGPNNIAISAACFAGVIAFAIALFWQKRAR